MVLRFLIVFVAILAAGGGAMALLITHPGASTAVLLPLVLLAFITGIAASAFRMLWTPMLAAYPAREPAPDAVCEAFQSIGLGIVNMGLSVHIAADAEYLHLTPLRPWQWLGARPASIPWTALTPVGKSGRVARLDGHRLDGPKWCMKLIQPAQDGEQDVAT